MGLGTAATVAIGAGALAGAGVSAWSTYSTKKEEEKEANKKADREIGLKESEIKFARRQRNRGREAISDQREAVDFQLDQAKEEAGRVEDTLDFQLDQVRSEFSQGLDQLHRSKRKTVEKIHREGAANTAEAAAAGVRGGGGVSTARADIQDQRQDLSYRAEQERANMDRQLAGAEQDVSDARAELEQRMEAEKFEHGQAHSDLSRERSRIDDQFNLAKEQGEAAIDEAEDFKDEYSFDWGDDWGDIALGAVQGGIDSAQIGLRIAGIMG